MNKLSTTLALVGALASCSPDKTANSMNFVDAHNDGVMNGLGNTSLTERKALHYYRSLHFGSGNAECFDVFDMVDGVRKSIRGIPGTAVWCEDVNPKESGGCGLTVIFDENGNYVEDVAC